MSSPLVFAITLNWNRLNDTVRCIESLINQTYKNLRVLVVDNHSDDGSPEEIAKLFPDVEQIINQENLGFLSLPECAPGSMEAAGHHLAGLWELRC